jgi:hypothetical protein
MCGPSAPDTPHNWRLGNAKSKTFRSPGPACCRGRTGLDLVYLLFIFAGRKLAEESPRQNTSKNSLPSSLSAIRPISAHSQGVASEGVLMVRRGRVSFIRAGKLTQTRYRRKTNQAQFATQSASIWCGRTESKIKGILAHRGSAPPTLISQDLTRKQTTSSGRENPSQGEGRFSPASFMGVIQKIGR